MTLWITLDCEIGGHPKMAALSSDTARYGWVLALTEAKKQRRPGTFASERHFRAVMGRHGRFVAEYLRVHLLDAGADDSLLVHDWQRHQWAAAKAAQRDGQREDIGETSTGLQVDASRAVSVPVSVGTPERDDVRPHDGLDDAVRWLAQRSVSVPEGRAPHVELARIVDQHGADAVIAAMASLPGPLHDGAQYVYGARNALNPIPASPRRIAPKGHQPDHEAALAAFNREGPLMDIRKRPEPVR